jgi:dihydrolipoamide dehydrogenase
MKLAIIGSGPGGYVAALRAARLGAEVTVIEEAEVGGTCLNRGCIPTKALLASTGMYARAKEMHRFGIEVEGTITPNIEKIMARKNKVVVVQVKGIRGLFRSWGVSLVEGRGKLLDPHRIEVTDKSGSRETVEAESVIVATGSRPAQIPTFPFDGRNILSSDDALNIAEIPESVLIVGAGVIGCEFACIFRELGSEVTMVEMLPRAVSTEDVEISELLAKELKKKKIKLLNGVTVERVEVVNGEVTALLGDGRELKAQKMLVSIGRAMNSNGIGLEEAGVETGARGEISVNGKMQTSRENIYAIGDVTGGMLLAHTASREGIVAADNICGNEASIDYSTVPAAIFTTPEIASVGLREFQAEENGVKVKTGHFQFRALGKSHAMGEISGFLKIVADSGSDKVLGAHIIGPHASDIIHEAALAIRKGLTAKDIAGTIHAHPTLSEGLMEAAEDVHDSAVHMPKN